MAASTVGLAGTFCRRLTAAFRRWGAGSRSKCTETRASFCGAYSSTAQLTPIFQCRSLHTSQAQRGLEEFFDDPKNWGEATVKSGDSWTASQLRAKGSEDLHKLWYVLLKEKNMLLTVEQEAKRQRMPMPSPERLEKVDLSIENLELVLRERETALRLLQTGQQKARPGDWRRDCFGDVTWYKFSEWPIPWFLNRRYKQRKFYALSYVDRFIRLKIEQNLRKKVRKERAKKDEMIAFQKRFPNYKADSQK
ncbi:large ribosomal subunit protein uL29m [Ambystoma mexicanum]|uniref:large ribosomal subunit protein uL29m n=1 Tax=Ambystoma mexicanum TaxID=8296 RepID=UPI0037E9941E